MSINWKVRLKNKAFWVALAAVTLPFIYNILGMLDIVPSVTQNMISDLIFAVLNILTALGIIIDPTTKGVGDSAQALTYTQPKQ